MLSSSEEEGDGTQGLRVLSGFMLLGASAAGVLPPIIRGVNSADSLEASAGSHRMKAFAAGVMLGLAIMHVIADAFSDMADLAEYPIAGVFVLLGLLFMFFVENLAIDVMSALNTHGALGKRGAYRKGKDSDVDEEGDAEEGAGCEFGPSRAAEGSELLEMEPLPNSSVDLPGPASAHTAASAKPAWADVGDGHAHAHVGPMLSAVTAVQHSQRLQGAGPSGRGGGGGGGLGGLGGDRSGHSHSGGGHSHGTMMLHPAGRRLIVAHLLELGVVVHSVIIGLDLGVMQRRGDIVGLVAVLAFHQFFEGVSLGSYIADLGSLVERGRKLFMAALFCATTPAGVFAGILVSEGYESGSLRARWVRGGLNGITGGMLLWMTLNTFIADCFGHRELGRPDKRRLKAEMYLLLLAGVLLMVVLALWA